FRKNVMQHAVDEDGVERAMLRLDEAPMIERKATGQLDRPGAVRQQPEHLGRVGEKERMPTETAAFDEQSGQWAAAGPDVEHSLVLAAQGRQLALDIGEDGVLLAGAVGIGEPDLGVVAERIVCSGLA